MNELQSDQCTLGNNDISSQNFYQKGPERSEKSPNLPLKMVRKKSEYQPSGEGGARSPPATPHRLQNPKWPPGGPKMADRVCKGVYLRFLGSSVSFCY